MGEYTTKTATDYCYNCEATREFENTYFQGQKVETMCTECGMVDSFPYDDED